MWDMFTYHVLQDLSTTYCMKRANHKNSHYVIFSDGVPELSCSDMYPMWQPRILESLFLSAWQAVTYPSSRLNPTKIALTFPHGAQAGSSLTTIRSPLSCTAMAPPSQALFLLCCRLLPSTFRLPRNYKPVCTHASVFHSYEFSASIA
jgi:hypothetical protein